MKGKFEAYVLRPLAKRVQNWIVDQSTARDFTVYIARIIYLLQIHQIRTSFHPSIYRLRPLCHGFIISPKICSTSSATTPFFVVLSKSSAFFVQNLPFSSYFLGYQSKAKSLAKANHIKLWKRSDYCSRKTNPVYGQIKLIKLVIWSKLFLI